MGLIKLALLGGAGYYAVKKINQNKHGNHQCQCNHQPQNREIDEYNPAQQYHNSSEKQLPQYDDQPSATYSYPNEKGGMQKN